MTAKKYLQQAKKCELSIRRIENKIQKIRDSLLLIGINYEGDRVQTSPKDRMSDGMADIDEVYRANLEQYSSNVKLLDTIENQIYGMEKKLYIDILSYHYLDDLSFNKVASLIGYDYDYVIHQHGKALLAFAKKYPDVLEADE